MVAVAAVWVADPAREGVVADWSCPIDLERRSRKLSEILNKINGHLHEPMRDHLERVRVSAEEIRQRAEVVRKAAVGAIVLGFGVAALLTAIVLMTALALVTGR